MPGTILFGEFALDFVAGELRKGGAAVKLTPQQFVILAALASRPGELVTRDDLRRRLWGDNHFVDVNAGLNFSIGQLRGVLGDSASDPRIIQTIPRRGYRFIATLTLLDSNEPYQSVAATGGGTPTIGGQRRSGAWRVAAAAMLGLVLGGLTVWLVVAGRPSSMVPSPGARDAYERARSGLEDASTATLRDRVLLFQRAVAEDPEYGAAFGGLALAHALAGYTRFAPPADAYVRARAAALTALSLDSSNGDAHAALGMEALFHRWAWLESEAHLTRAVKLDPKHVLAFEGLSVLRSALGEHNRAITAAREAVAVDPAAPGPHVTLGWSYLYAQRLREAGVECAFAQRLRPGLLSASQCLLNARTDERDPEAAFEATKQTAITLGRGPAAIERLHTLYASDGIAGLWQWRLEDLEHRLPPADRDREAQALAVFHARLGHTNEAIAWLQQAAQRRADLVILLRVFPGFRVLHGDPRFEELARQLGLPARTS